MCWNANSPRNMRKSGWGPWLGFHLMRLVRTPSWAWRLDLHDPGCRWAALWRRS